MERPIPPGDGASRLMSLSRAASGFLLRPLQAPVCFFSLLIFTNLANILLSRLLPPMAAWGLSTVAGLVWCVLWSMIVLPPMKVILRRGQPSRRLAWACVAAITVLQGLAWYVRARQGLPLDPYEAQLFAGPVSSTIVLLAVTLVVGPLQSEILDRHIVFSALPWERGHAMAALSILLGAFVSLCASMALQRYAVSHLYVLLAGIVYGIARYLSRGLLLPVGLYFYSQCLALLVAYRYA